ncbi:hypothetical protein GCM10023184_47200 [Flaviaesturariibacter amylovorans]|uniref:Uncharacterized protein n=1 Tax=Flaviaesturariibacter amylovorans TaxID=1084520 RepID=A0ABP8HVF4_9BACT
MQGALEKIGSLCEFLTTSKIPVRLQSKDDIDAFWKAFDALQATMKVARVSYLKETTTLLHYLLDTGFDCVKPDSVVMKVAKKIGIVESETGDRNFRAAVRFVQEYCLERQLRPAVVDLYFLIYGGQEEARKFVRPRFYERLN